MAALLPRRPGRQYVEWGTFGGMRVGLVLGAGGVLGASWLIGALEALEAETGWRAGDAERIVGTSAGAVIGAFAAAGVSPGHMNAYASGSRLDALAEAERRAGDQARRVTGTEYRLALALPPLGPGSWQLALTTMLRPRRYAPAAVLAGWLPRGFISTAPIRELVAAFVPGEWPEHPGSGRWPPTTRAASAWRSAATARRPPPSPMRSPPRARSRASTTPSGSPGAATSTAASARRPTSTCCATHASTSSCA